MKKVNPIEEKFLTLMMEIIVNGGTPIWDFLTFIVWGERKKV